MNQVAFINYMMDFYGARGLYPELDFTVPEVTAGLRVYLRTNPEFCGDSLDRERVRDIVLTQRGQNLTING